MRTVIRLRRLMTGTSSTTALKASTVSNCGGRCSRPTPRSLPIWWQSSTNMEDAERAHRQHKTKNDSSECPPPQDNCPECQREDRPPHHGKKHDRAESSKSRDRKPLPETMRLPCAKTFAVGKTSGTRQRQGLPCATRTGTRQSCSTRQRKDLPCARRNGPRQRSGTQQTMHLCRVPNLGHKAKMAASDVVWSTDTFAVCLNKAHGKDSICCVFYFEHTAKVYQNSWIWTSQIFWHKNTGNFAPCQTLVIFSIYLLYLDI